MADPKLPASKDLNPGSPPCSSNTKFYTKPLVPWPGRQQNIQPWPGGGGGGDATRLQEVQAQRNSDSYIQLHVENKKKIFFLSIRF